MLFSQDSKLLAAQGGGPDWSLVLWQWEKSKVLASVRTSNPLGAPMTQVSHPMTWAHSSSRGYNDFNMINVPCRHEPHMQFHGSMRTDHFNLFWRLKLCQPVAGTVWAPRSC